MSFQGSSLKGKRLDGPADRVRSFVVPDTVGRRDHHLQGVPLLAVTALQTEGRVQVWILMLVGTVQTLPCE